MPQKLRFAMVCASNQNRSMEAHRVLKENKFNVCMPYSGLNVGGSCVEGGARAYNSNS